MLRFRSFLACAGTVCVLLGALAPASHAGLTDALKKKIGDTLGKKVEDKADQTLGTTSEASPAKEESAAETAEAKSGSGDGKVSSVSTKFDFVPGDHVLFLDDFTQDELGEFPAKWNLSEGTYEVAERQGERWLRCTSTSGHVRMKAQPAIPEFWTLEFDLYAVGLGGAIALDVYGLTNTGATTWQVRYPYSGTFLRVECGSIEAMTPVEGTPIEGRHHVMLMGRGTALKVYLDRERLASVPDVTGPGATVGFDFRLGAPGKPMISNVRFAEGCRPAKDMLAEGKLVTYGIRFATGSDVVLPESAPVLRQVAAYMQTNAAVKLGITGHTDNVGSSPSNLDLSKRRAAAVAGVLSSQFGIGADRFETQGKGDAQPLSSNAKAEGRAMNRRVEFAKL